MERELEEERKALEALQEKEKELTNEAHEFTLKSLPEKVGEALLAGWKELVILTFKGLSIVELFTDPVGALKSYLTGEAMEELEISQKQVADLKKLKQNLDEVKELQKKLAGEIDDDSQDIKEIQDRIDANKSAVLQAVELAGLIARIKDTLRKAQDAAAKSLKDGGEATNLLGKIGKNQIKEVAEACEIAEREGLVSKIAGLASMLVDAARLADEKFELAEAKVNVCQSKEEWQEALSAYNEGKQAAQQAASYYRQVEEGEVLLKKILSEAELARSSLAEPAGIVNAISPLVESAEKSSKAAHSWVDEARKLLDDLEKKRPAMVTRVTYLRLKADTISAEAGRADNKAKAVREALLKAKGIPEHLKKLALCGEIIPPKGALDEAAQAMALLGMGGLGEGIPKKAEACLAKLNSDEITVPNLAVFDNVSEMKAVLGHAGLGGAFVAAGEPPSKDKEFKWAHQSEAPGTKVKRGTTVTVGIYQKVKETEADEVTVPNLAVFDNVSEMKVVLGHAGLVGAFAATGEAPSKEKEFKWAGQSPAPDTKVKRGSTITVSLYQAFVDDEVTVPNLAVFDNVSEMKVVLGHAGLVGAFAAASQAPSKEKEFKWAGQSPAPDTKVKRGSTVTVSLYQKYVDASETKNTVPNVVGLTLERAVAQLEAAGLTVGGIEVGAKPPAPEKANFIYLQTPAAGDKVPANNLVALKQYGSGEESRAVSDEPTQGTDALGSNDNLDKGGGVLAGTWGGPCKTGEHEFTEGGTFQLQILPNGSITGHYSASEGVAKGTYQVAGSMDGSGAAIGTATSQEGSISWQGMIVRPASPGGAWSGQGGWTSSGDGFACKGGWSGG